MHATQLPAQIEFCYHHPDNLILLEQGEEGIVIRAVHDNFSEQRKICFIKELAAEGFIPDEYQWLAGVGYGCRVHWVIDRSWLSVPEVVRRRATKVMVRALLSAGLLFVMMMGLVILTAK